VKFYLSKDMVLDDTDVLVGSVPPRRITLNPKNVRVFTTRLRPPIDLVGGRYYLFAVITPAGGIVQSNPTDLVGIARHPVRVVRNRPPFTANEEVYLNDICYDGEDVDCSSDEPEETATTQPSDNTGKPPASGPSTQPGVPQTQPSTGPAKSSGDPGDPGDSDDSASDSGGGDDSGGDGGGGGDDFDD
jgi:hypothetical protein